MTSSMLGLRTTIYKVPDLDAAKAWYGRAFGVEAYFDQPFYVGFNVAGYELGLLPEDGPAKPGSDNVLSYWGVADIDDAFAQLLELGASVHTAPTNVGGEIMVASVHDPWGNVIGLIYNPEFKAE